MKNISYKKSIAFITAMLMTCATVSAVPSEYLPSFLTVSAEEVISDGIQVTEEYFPDAYFRDYILKNIADENGFISKDKISSVTALNLLGTYESRSDCKSLKGIEYFTELKSLNCQYCYLAQFDLSKNTELESLDCNGNFLIELDLSNNTKLESLECYGNNLTQLDLSKNTELTELNCGANPLTQLDLSKNTKLKSLNCMYNKFEQLDLSNNTELETLDCKYNKFEQLDLSKNIKLKTLYCDNNPLKQLDLSNNTELIYLDCKLNQLTELDVSKNTELIYLDCKYNQLTELIVSNTKLESLDCSHNQFTELDLRNYTKLEVLECSYNQLTLLDISNNTALAHISASNNYIEELDISNNPLIGIAINSNNLTSLDVTDKPQLESLFCSGNKFTELDVSKNPLLTNLHCDNLGLETLDLSKNPNLKQLSCKNNKLAALDLTNCKNMNYVSINDNTVNAVAKGNVLNTSSLKGFDLSRASDWTGAQVTDGVVTVDSGADKVTYTYDCGNGHKMTVTLNITHIDGASVEINAESFPDASFRQFILDNFDTDKNGYLSPDEIRSITSVNVSDKNISSLEGIEYFTALEALECNNNKLTSLDLSANTALTQLECDDNQLSVTADNNVFALSTLAGFDASKASNWQGAVYNAENNTITLSADTVTYNYDCGNSLKASFMLKANYTADKPADDPAKPEHTHSYSGYWYSDGTYHWHQCECGERADISSHIRDAGIVTKEPYMYTDGVITYYCCVCGIKLAEEIIPYYTADEWAIPLIFGTPENVSSGAGQADDSEEVIEE